MSNNNIKYIIILSIVPLLWGTFPPLIRWMYSSINTINKEHEFPILLFNVLSYIISSSVLICSHFISYLYHNNNHNNIHIDDRSITCPPKKRYIDDFIFLIKSIFHLNQNKNIQKKNDNNNNKNKRKRSISLEKGNKNINNLKRINEINNKKKYVGWELGGWLYLGSIFQVIGLKLTSATRASFLIQLTTILVPILDIILVNKKTKINSKLWFSSCLALFGVFILTFDSTKKENRTIIENETIYDVLFGDILVLFAALFFSIHVVRLGYYSKHLKPTNISWLTSFSQLIYSFSTILMVILLQIDSIDPYIFYLKNFINLDIYNISSNLSPYFIILFVIFWNGCITTALTSWAQSYGQQAVSATQANLIYSTQAIWATLFSILFIGEEIGILTIIGGFLLIISCINAAFVK